VVDLNGNTHAPTYLRRAKGLVKTGRARWAEGDNVICLTGSPAEEGEQSSPLQYKEDFIMDRYDNDGFKIVDGVRVETEAEVKAETIVSGDPDLTVGYLLAQIEAIRKDTGYILSSVGELRQMETGHHSEPYSPGDIAGKAKAEAFAQIVRHREETNQKMLLFYENLLYGLTKLKPAEEKASKPTSHMPTQNIAEVMKGVKELVEAVDQDSEMGRVIGEAVSDMLRGLYK